MLRWLPITFVVALLPTLLAGDSPARLGRTEAFNTPATVVSDMQPSSEGSPYRWSIPAPSLSYNSPPPGTARVQGWGQVWPDSSGIVTAARAEIKNFETYVWSKSQSRWIQVQHSLRPNGAYFQYTGHLGTHQAAPWRIEPDGGESAPLKLGWTLHFYATGIATIDPNDVGGVFTTVQLRLLGAAKYVANVGADFYAANGSYSFNNNPNVGVGQSKYIYLTAAWRVVSFYTGGPPSVIATGKYPSLAWTEQQFLASPPPMDGMGLP